MTHRIPLIVDTDTAADDCFALMLAATAERADLRAVTIVQGNIGFAQQVENALLTLEIVGRAGEVPVYRGAPQALIEPRISAEDIHGDGVGGQRRTGAEQPESEHAVSALIRLAREFAGELKLVAIGPLTNIALATALDPEFASHVRELVIMGGSINGRGNVTAVSEYNIAVDPEAAAIVLAAGFPSIRFVTWDPLTTTQGSLTQQDIDTIAALETPRAKFFVRANAQTFAFDVSQGLPGSSHCDSIAVLTALDPALVLDERPYEVSVERSGNVSRGQTVFDWMSSTPNATAIERIDHERFVGSMLAMLRKP